MRDNYPPHMHLYAHTYSHVHTGTCTACALTQGMGLGEHVEGEHTGVDQHEGKHGGLACGHECG
jgi:hypothetical protein